MDLLLSLRETMVIQMPSMALVSLTVVWPQAAKTHNADLLALSATLLYNMMV